MIIGVFRSLFKEKLKLYPLVKIIDFHLAVQYRGLWMFLFPVMC